jgi:hypothetical protein
VGGKAERLSVRALGGNANDFGDDVAGAFHYYLIADLETQALNLVLVMQRGAGDGDAPDFHGLETRHGG